MAYDQELEKRIEMYAVQMVKKKMFGGLCYLLNGNMAFCKRPAAKGEEIGGKRSCKSLR